MGRDWCHMRIRPARLVSYAFLYTTYSLQLHVKTKCHLHEKNYEEWYVGTTYRLYEEYLKGSYVDTMYTLHEIFLVYKGNIQFKVC